MRIHVTAYDAMEFVQWNVTYSDEGVPLRGAQHLVGGYYRRTVTDEPDEELWALVSAIWDALKLRRSP